MTFEAIPENIVQLVMRSVLPASSVFMELLSTTISCIGFDILRNTGPQSLEILSVSVDRSSRQLSIISMVFKSLMIQL